MSYATTLSFLYDFKDNFKIQILKTSSCICHYFTEFIAYSYIINFEGLYRTKVHILVKMSMFVALVVKLWSKTSHILIFTNCGNLLFPASSVISWQSKFDFLSSNNTIFLFYPKGVVIKRENVLHNWIDLVTSLEERSPVRKKRISIFTFRQRITFKFF